MSAPFKIVCACVGCLVVAAICLAVFSDKAPWRLIGLEFPWSSDAPPPPAKAATVVSDQPTVEISAEGLRLLKIGTVAAKNFTVEIRDVGVIDFDQDMYAAVYPSYQGKIVEALADLGQHVTKGQVLYTINSPDLLQAEQTLIQTAGVFELTTRNLARLHQSVRNGGGAQKDLDQAQSDQQTAVGAYNAAKQALKVFDKTEADADRIVATRTVDPTLAVKSPIAGMISSRNAAPGMLVQPGTAPAPYSVSDLDHVRMYEFVSEDEVTGVRLGAEVTARVDAYPGRVFSGRVTAIPPSLDPNTRRLQVETVIADPQHLLRPNMFATLAIQVHLPLRSLSVPANAVVRLSDGTMTVWTTTDERHFTQRLIRLGLQQDRFDQVLEGVKAGERIVTEGAVFVSNVANADAAP